MTEREAAVTDLLLRLARVVQAMALDTQWHDQMFDLVADIEQMLIIEDED